MNKFIYVLLCGAALASGPVCSADREWIDYKRLLEITSLEKFYAAPAAQRDRVRVFGTMKPNNPAIDPSQVVFTVVHGAERKHIAVGADGSFDPMLDPVWAKHNPKVLTSMPAGEKAGFSFGVAPVVPAGLHFEYAALMASVVQANALIKSQAGIMRFLMPTFVGLALRYPHGQAASARIASARGETVVNTNAEGVLRLPLNFAMLAESAKVTLSQRPQSIDLIAD